MPLETTPKCRGGEKSPRNYLSSLRNCLQLNWCCQLLHLPYNLHDKRRRCQSPPHPFPSRSSPVSRSSWHTHLHKVKEAKLCSPLPPASSSRRDEGGKYSAGKLDFKDQEVMLQSTSSVLFPSENHLVALNYFHFIYTCFQGLFFFVAYCQNRINGYNLPFFQPNCRISLNIWKNAFF